MTGRLRRLLWPAVMTAAMLAVLLGLGTWQVERLHWKQALLARIALAEAAPPIPLPAEPQPFTKVAVIGRLRNDLSAQYGAEVHDTPSGPQLGSRLIVPLERQGAEPLLVDRGWVPSTRRQPISLPDGEVTIEGYVRPGDRLGFFAATDNPAERLFYTLDPAAIGTALGLQRVAPFVLVAMGLPPPEHWPAPARHLPRPPNNHLSYAITWYGLAFSLVVIFVIWARRTLSA